MTKPDAMDMEKIGLELVEEFSEESEEEYTRCRLSTLYESGRGFGGVGPGRANTERLIELLERCGFQIVGLDHV